MTPPTLHGYKFSVYNRMAKMALHEKQVPFTVVEVNPFTDNTTNPHPFNRVPTLAHNDFTLYETRAITAYIDRAFNGPSLMLTAPQAAARVEQCLSIIDNYAYWPLVRQVFSNRIFAPLIGESPNEPEIQTGLAAAPAILTALNTIAAEGLILNGPITRADCHLAPILDYFTQAPEGRTALTGFTALSEWFADIQSRNSFASTAPDLASL